MKYAKSYHSRPHPKAPKSKANPVVETDMQLCRPDAAGKGRSRGAKRPQNVSTAGNVADVFLKTTFLPKLETLPAARWAGKEEQALQRDFYRSFRLFAEHYEGFRPTDTKPLGYPYNIALSLWEAESYLKENYPVPIQLRWVRDEESKSFLVSQERFDTGTSLYYIPVIPLYRMLKDRKRRLSAQLLLSVCSYLYHIVDIPYYRQENSYLFWEYDMILQWAEDDMEEDNRESLKREISIAEWIGDRIQQKLYSTVNLNVFEKRLNRFQCRDDFDRDCLKMASQAFDIYRDYPDQHIFRHASTLTEDEDYIEDTIGMCKYISFIAHTTGHLYDTLADCINNEFNEYPQMEEPTICKQFDGSLVTVDNLDFESRIFSLLDQLCYLLNNY